MMHIRHNSGNEMPGASKPVICIEARHSSPSTAIKFDIIIPWMIVLGMSYHADNPALFCAYLEHERLPTASEGRLIGCTTTQTFNGFGIE